MQQNIQIDPQRLWDAIMETAEFGKTAKGGVKRLTLTDLDKQVRDWFRQQCEAVGCTVTVDEVGNMFARRPGQDGRCRRSASAAISTPSRRAASSTASWACCRGWSCCARCTTPATRPTRQSR